MKETAKEIFLEAVGWNTPSHLIEDQVSVVNEILTIEDKHWSIGDRPVYVAAVGKASVAMSSTLQKMVRLPAENMITIAPQPDDKPQQQSNVYYASHPYPSEQSEQAAEALIQFSKEVPAGALVLFAISGGTSALVSKPVQAISMDAYAELNKLLLNSGADIAQINSVRKRLSQIKGGKLLNYFPSDITLVDLAISDVPGNNLAYIGSGPTIPDTVTFKEVYDILAELELLQKVPTSVYRYLEEGRKEEADESSKRVGQPTQEHDSFIIGSARSFAESLAEIAANRGFEPHLADQYYTDSVKEVINQVMKDVGNHENSPQAFIYYGESTANITGAGKGGRNQEMALQAAVKISKLENITWLSADTDGIDGPTDAAGAVVNDSTVEKAQKKGLDVNKFIENNDSYRFHQKMNTHLITGPTGNNLMDAVLVLTN